ncbi:MAG: tetratricopeptide repeat protein [Cyanobacteria bacterium SZAS-4]|nr:tetratricopeptide repeat protein [Cyanobacteria bacterium SZAS-4]
MAAANEAVKLGPNQVANLLGRAQFEIRDNHYREAIKDCDAALKVNPKAGGAYSRRGFSYCQLGNYDQGIADLSRSIDLQQIELTGWDAPFDYKNRSVAYRHVGKTKLAEKDEQMVRVYSAIERARGYRGQIKLGPAIAIMNDAVKIRPDDKYLRYFRGIAFMNDGKLEDAINDFTFVMKQDPTCLSVPYFRGDCYSRLRRMQDAINDYTKILAKNPYVVAISDTAETGRCSGHELTYDESIVSPSDIYVLRARQYVLLKQHDKALSDFNKAISMTPTDFAARKERANLYLDMKNIPMALQDCNAIIAQEPRRLEFYELRAKILETNKQPEKALDDLNKIVNLSKTDPPAYLRRGQLLDRLGQHAKAISDYTTAADLNPSEDDAFRYRGTSYFKLGQYDKAVEDYSQAISRDPVGNVETYSLRALAYDKLGKTDLASKDRRTAKESQSKKI